MAASGCGQDELVNLVFSRRFNYPSGQDEPNFPTRISRVCTVRKTSLAHRQILARHPSVK